MDIAALVNTLTGSVTQPKPQRRIITLAGGLFLTLGCVPALIGLTAVPARAAPVITAAQAAFCGVTGGRLSCSNDAGAPLRDKPSSTLPSSQIVDHLRTTYSWFACWSEGQRNRGGTTTWYKTEGDDHGRWGWVSAEFVDTVLDFDRNPSAHGLSKCQYPWPP